MSTRIDDRSRGGHLDEDDDWFAPTGPQAVEVDDPPWESEPEWESEDPASQDLGKRQAGIVLAVIAAIFLVVAGFLVGRLTTDSSTTVVTVTSVAKTPAASTTTTPTTTTPTTTTPVATTPTASTPTATTPTSTTPSSAAVPTDATLRPGMKGSSVTALQTGLTTLGYTTGAADGSYGATTTQAVSAFQTANNLTADGIAGPKTLAAINAALAQG